MDSTDLRPLSFGELLDHTFTYFRRHFLLFFAIMAVPQVFILVFSLTLAALQRFHPPHAASAGASAQNARFLSVATVGGISILVVYFVVYGVALGATAFAISDIHLGRAVTARGAYQRIRGRFWALLELDFRVALRVLLAFVLFMVGAVILPTLIATAGRHNNKLQAIAGALLALAGVALGVVWTVRIILRYGCAIPALLLENIKPGIAIKRSVALTKKRLGRVFLVCLLMGVVTWMVAVILEGPFLFAQSYILMRHHTQPAFWLTVCGGIMGAVGYAATGPLVMIGLVLLYYDIRVRKEGFDLQVMMSALDAQTGGVSALPGLLRGAVQGLVPTDSSQATAWGQPTDPSRELESCNVALVVALAFITFGLYYPVWFLRRRSGINSLHSSEKIGVGIFAAVLALLSLTLLLDLSQGYFTSAGMSWLRWFNIIIWFLSSVLLLIQAFKVKRILEEHAEKSSRGLFGGSISLAQESSLSGVATFFFGIFYLQYKINKIIEVWTDSHPNAGTDVIPAC